MNFNLAKLLCYLIILFSGHAFAADPPVDIRPWEVGVVSPSYYPVEVEQSYGINESDNWTSLIFEFDTYRRSQQKIARKYDGYAIPLIGPAISKAQQRLPTRTLPDSMHIYWASLAEHKMYVTQFYLTEKIKNQMMAAGRWSGRQPGGRHCYKNLIVFGLLPGGDAKVWLYGCDTFTHVGTVSAIKETNGYPRNNLYLEAVSEDVKQYTMDNNIQLFPIPKDKIDKVIVSKRYEVLK